MPVNHDPVTASAPQGHCKSPQASQRAFRCLLLKHLPVSCDQHVDESWLTPTQQPQSNPLFPQQPPRPSLRALHAKFQHWVSIIIQTLEDQTIKLLFALDNLKMATNTHTHSQLKSSDIMHRRDQSCRSYEYLAAAKGQGVNLCDCDRSWSWLMINTDV